MKESLEKEFGLTVAQVMESQSAMIFKAREEISNLHQELEKLRKENLDLSTRESSQLRNSEIVKNELCEALEYACKLYRFVSDKCNYLVPIDEIEKELGSIPHEVFVTLRSINLTK